MTQKQQTAMDELLDCLSENEISIYRETVNHLVELGYIPQKNRSYLSFKHKENGIIIAKIKKGEIKIKFFACKNVPQKYIDALRCEMEASNGQYSMQVPSPDNSPVPTGVIMKKCTLACNVCTGGKMRYYFEFPDEKVVFRCGAYPVTIPDIKENDIDELKQIISEQHNYFISIAKRGEDD
jgi:hypothetical protein